MSLAVDLPVVAGIFAVGLAVESYAGVDETRRSLPARARTAVGAVSLGGAWLGYFLDLMPAVLVDASVVALAVSVGLWLGLPVVVSRFVDAVEVR